MGWRINKYTVNNISRRTSEVSKWEIIYWRIDFGNVKGFRDLRFGINEYNTWNVRIGFNIIYGPPGFSRDCHNYFIKKLQENPNEVCSEISMAPGVSACWTLPDVTIIAKSRLSEDFSKSLIQFPGFWLLGISIHFVCMGEIFLPNPGA